jgi:hypothetical protein
MWLRRDLVIAPDGTMLWSPEGAAEAEVIDLRDEPSLSSSEVREEPLQQDSA